MADEPVVHVVDDDEGVRQSLRFLLEMAGLKVATYQSGGDFLNHAGRIGLGCVLTDVRMPDIDGLELQRQLHERGERAPVIVMTGHGEVPIAVQAMKAGAVDFIEKPFSDDVLIASVQAAIERSQRALRNLSETAALDARLHSLTPREREVLDGLVAGLPNKTIAYNLGISARTVEVHRARVMEKMQARSLSELVRMALSVLGGPGQGENGEG